MNALEAMESDGKIDIAVFAQENDAVLPISDTVQM
jgi:hypothetical protein